MDNDKIKFLSNKDNDNDKDFRSFVTKMMRQSDMGNIEFVAMYYETKNNEPHLFLNESGDKVKNSGTLHLMAASLENMQIEDYYDSEDDENN